MKKLISSLAVLFALAVPQIAHAQIDLDADNDFRGRLSVEADYKIFKGFHASLSEEIRVANNFRSFDRFMTTAAISYKPISYLKIGAGYTFMSMLDTDPVLGNTWDLRHRAFLELTGMYEVDGWKFSLRERFQTTFRTDEYNIYQSPKAESALRSRLKVSYEFESVPLEPYVAFEPRVTFSGVNVESVAKTADEAKNPDYKVVFNNVYVNRYRTQAGLEYKVAKHHSLDFYFLGDFWNDTVVDTNKEGKLKRVQDPSTGEYVYAVYFRKGFNASLCVGYKFSF